MTILVRAKNELEMIHARIARLNKLSDVVGADVLVLEKTMREDHPAVTKEVDFGHGRLSWARNKESGLWAFQITKDGVTWDFNASPRFLRIMAYDKLHDLIRALAEEADAQYAAVTKTQLWVEEASNGNQ